VGGLKEAQVQSYSLPGDANVPSWEGTLAQLGKFGEDAALCQITLSTCFDDGNNSNN